MCALWKSIPLWGYSVYFVKLLQLKVVLFPYEHDNLCFEKGLNLRAIEKIVVVPEACPAGPQSVQVSGIVAQPGRQDFRAGRVRALRRRHVHQGAAGARSGAPPFRLGLVQLAAERRARPSEGRLSSAACVAHVRLAGAEEAAQPRS